MSDFFELKLERDPPLDPEPTRRRLEIASNLRSLLSILKTDSTVGAGRFSDFATLARKIHSSRSISLTATTAGLLCCASLSESNILQIDIRARPRVVGEIVLPSPPMGEGDEFLVRLLAFLPLAWPLPSLDDMATFCADGCSGISTPFLLRISRSAAARTSLVNRSLPNRIWYVEWGVCVRR